MKRSDICVVSAVYLIALAFFVMTVQLPDEAQTYPMGLIIGMALLNTLFLIQQLAKAWAAGVLTKTENDFPTIFSTLLPRQFAFALAGCLLFLVLMYSVGYYAASILYLVGTLFFFKVPSKWILMTLVALVALVYAVFTLFLKVPLPAGVLFS